MRASRVANLLLAATLLLGPGRGDACCPASAREHDVKIADQEILIVWDPATKTEHFVRKAAFATGGPRTPREREVQRLEDELRRRDGKPPRAKLEGFGFLVPTPTKPEVAASDGRVFDALNRRIAPRYVTVTRWRPAPTALVLWPFLATRGLRSAGMATPAPEAAMRKMAVEVLETKRVGGFDVAVLAASDAGALTDWLKQNGYDARPQLTEWAEPYVKKGWIVTAFKYAADAGAVEVDAVRLSFQTDVPLFPYRVPTDNIAPAGEGHILRSFVVGPGRAAGTLGEGGAAKPYAQAAVKHAGPVAQADLAALIGAALPAGAAAKLADGAWLTAFEDPTWPSGTDDLTFAHDPAGQPYHEVIETVVTKELPIPLDLILLAGVVGVVVVRRRKAAAAKG